MRHRERMIPLNQNNNMELGYDIIQHHIVKQLGANIRDVSHHNLRCDGNHIIEVGDEHIPHVVCVNTKEKGNKVICRVDIYTRSDIIKLVMEKLLYWVGSILSVVLIVLLIMISA